MVKRTESIQQLFKQEKDWYNQTVTISGWVRTIRASKAFGFM